MSPGRWVVVVEAMAGSAEGGLDIQGLQSLLAALPDACAIGLHSPERYAVQLQIAAPGEAEAVFLALARVRAAAEILGEPSPRVVRTEVLTLEEFERDCGRAYREPHSAAVVDAARPGTGSSLGQSLLREVFLDPLTQLAGRSLFVHHLEHAVAGARRLGTVLTVVVLDLDGLRDINRRWGRSGGDHVLVTTAERLESTLGPTSTLARIGEDEFAALVEQPSREDVVEVVEALVAALSRPIDLGGAEVHVSASAGTATSEPHLDAEALLSRASCALSAAKGRARGGDNS